MTRDEIVKLAQESGFRAGHITLTSGDPIAFIAPLSATSCIVELERFAALVAAAEREACAKVCEERAEAWQAAHLAGQRAMQERAAAVCDEHAIQAAIFKAAVNEDGGPAFRHCCLDTASGAMDSAAEEIRDLEVKP